MVVASFATTREEEEFLIVSKGQMNEKKKIKANEIFLLNAPFPRDLKCSFTQFE